MSNATADVKASFTTRDTRSIYNFSPFLTAPAVRSIARASGRITTINIPSTPCPSPFARNITPDQLTNLKTHLVGPQTGNRGREVWESWKRAWDLWNNHYIEGRVNAEWVKKEWDRRAKEKEERPRRRRFGAPRSRRELGLLSPEQEPKLYTEYEGVDPPEPEPGRKWIKKENRKFTYETGDSVSRWETKKVPKAAWDVKGRKRGKGGQIPRRVAIKKFVAGPEADGGKWEDSDDYKLVEGPFSDYEEGQEIEDDEGEEVEVEVEIMEPEMATGILPVWQLVDDFHDTRPKPKKKKAHVKKQVSPPSPPSDNSGSSSPIPIQEADDDHIVIIDVDSDSEDEDEDEWIPHTEEVDGSSGGFYAMKDLKEYQQHVGEEWKDILTNTVWRPRRVGEKTLQIDMDEDFHENLDGNELMVDGGVDCGKSPHPVLRWVDNYVRVLSRKKVYDRAIKKKRQWDGVTGTVFNMPTKPLEPDSDSEDERHVLIKAMFGEFTIQDPLAHKTDIFPLDIRRVNLVSNPSVCSIEDKSANEELVRYSWDNPIKDYRPMEAWDPWYVTEEQEAKRDVPPRRYPAREPNYEGNSLIPLDDVNWVQNRVMDELGDANYFVTNLHGGTLIINGQEIKKGQVAGPLPAFAVIESPGGQVSFWWGVRGRNWNQSSQPSRERDWEILRQAPEWKYLGLKAGVVWDSKIQDRIKREEEGDEEDDDELWKSWKNPKSSEPDLDAMTDAEYGAHFGTGYITNDYLVAADQAIDEPGPQKEIPPPSTFETEEEELKWVAVKSKVLNEKANEVVRSSLIEPRGKSFWPGTISQEDVQPLGHITESSMEDHWRRDKRQVIATQQAAIGRITEEEEADKAKILDCRKRRRGDDVTFQEKVKRRKADLALEIERLKAQEQANENEAKAAALNDETTRLAARREREREASIAALVKREGLSELEATQSVDDARNEIVKRWHALNQQRLAEGKEELPGRALLTPTQVAEIPKQRKIPKGVHVDEKERESKEDADRREKAWKAAFERAKNYGHSPTKKSMVKNELQNTTKLVKKEVQSKVQKQTIIKPVKQGNIKAEQGSRRASERISAGKKEKKHEWKALEDNGGNIDTSTLITPERQWFLEHLHETAQGEPVPPPSSPTDLHPSIQSNLAARALTAKSSPAAWVRANTPFASVAAYIAATATHMYEDDTRKWEDVAREQFLAGLQARCRLSHKQPDDIAAEKGYKDSEAWFRALTRRFRPWTRPRKPPALPEGVGVGEAAYEAYVVRRREWESREAQSLMDWRENNRILLREVGDYEAEVLLADEERERRRRGGFDADGLSAEI